MDRLWAPWRIKYIKAKLSKKCLFCECLKYKQKHHLIFKTKYSIAILNIFPYNNGHMMVSPIRHVRDLKLLSDLEILDLFHAVNRVKGLLDKVLKPDGYNIGINMSSAAGAGIASHLHIHVVPRWVGDTNFMPIIYNTKIVSQSLDDLYRKLKKC